MQTLQFFLKRITTYLCCFATSSMIFTGQTIATPGSTRNNQLITSIKNDLKSSQKEFGYFISQKKVCLTVLPKCLVFKNITKPRHFYFSNKEENIIEFPLILDLKKLEKLSSILKLTPEKQKTIIQNSSIILNNWSTQWFNKQYLPLLKQSNLSVINIAINNALLISNKNSSIIIDNYAPSKTQMTIGILDSGVSTYHQQMEQVDVIQYNPNDQSFELRDTALGHASGILSLLAVKQNKDIKKGFISHGKYLSCNGLPKGKFNEDFILQCMNWFFLQPKVDVILNAWLVSQPGCKNEWQLPIEALLTSNIIPIFSAGNYANSKKGMNFSPANLILSDLDYPLVTVGALDEQTKRLPMSNFGISRCKNNHSFEHFQANLFAKGENLKVANPLGKNTYQLASGTSYSIAEVASIIAKLKHEFPLKSNKIIVNAVLNSADNKKGNVELGYGKINYLKAQSLLMKN